MIQAIGETEEVLGLQNPLRIIQCGTCGQKQKVVDAMQNGAFCIQCDEAICVFCGCTERVPCVHEDFPKGEYRCGWKDQGMCDFCYFESAEEIFFIVTGREALVKAKYAAPAIILI